MKTLIFAALTIFSVSINAANYCDAVIKTTAHEWGLQIDIVSTSSTEQDCFFGVAIAPAGETTVPDQLRWLLSRNEPGPRRFATDDSCRANGGVQLYCGLGLKSGASATILGVREQPGVGACYTARVTNYGFFSGVGGLQQRESRLVCLPN